MIEHSKTQGPWAQDPGLAPQWGRTPGGVNNRVGGVNSIPGGRATPAAAPGPGPEPMGPWALGFRMLYHILEYYILILYI